MASAGTGITVSAIRQATTAPVQMATITTLVFAIHWTTNHCSFQRTHAADAEADVSVIQQTPTAAVKTQASTTTVSDATMTEPSPMECAGIKTQVSQIRMATSATTSTHFNPHIAAPATQIISLQPMHAAHAAAELTTATQKTSTAVS